MALLRKPRRSSDLRLLRMAWRHDIVKKGLPSWRWRASRRSALLVPRRTNSGTKPRNLSGGGGVSCQSWLTPTRGRWRADLRSISTDVRRGRLNTDPPAPVATGQTVKACTTGCNRRVSLHGFTAPRRAARRSVLMIHPRCHRAWDHCRVWDRVLDSWYSGGVARLRSPQKNSALCLSRSLQRRHISSPAFAQW